ncbi:hypothetical protein [Streptomyces sp. Je 1-332]|uniref:nSTAND1 domain-containing NTPase n=1 Tax=Streptomyces sp. Je 1-332 TaxID=3231270 RepID=UPI00345A7AE3
MGRQEKTIDPEAGPVQRFAFELRALRREAGGPPYRVMAQEAGYSVAALSRAAAGETQPSLPLTLAYVKACGGDTGEWARRWEAVRDEEASPSGALDLDLSHAPYRGLTRFEPGDLGRFFGRGRPTESLAAMASAQRCVMVVGPSGIGKSSLLRAGFIPRLQNTKDPASRPAAIRILTPGPRPVRDHEKVFVPAEGPGETWLVVDQFEEIFTLCRDVAERREFIRLLLTAQDPGSRLRVVLGVRADFYVRCLEHEGLADVLAQACVPVAPMTPNELREVIVKPAAAEGLIVERKLTARLVEETGEEPGGLPLMSHTLLETWRHRRGRTLALAGYEAAGGLHGAIAQTAERVYAQASSAQQEAMRVLFLRLTVPGDGSEDTRRRVELEELEGLDLTALLQELVAARLIVTGEGTVEVAHEAVIRAWPRLQHWLSEDRDAIRVHRQLTTAAGIWHDLGGDESALYRGVQLAVAQEWAESRSAALNDQEARFLHAGLAADQRRTRRTHQLIAALSVLLVLALTAAGVAVHKTSAADTQRRLALSRELAARADEMSEKQPAAAMVVALRGYRQASTTEARGSLLSAYADYNANQLTGHTGAVQTTAYAPDGRTLASASFDHTVKLWDARSHRLLATLAGHTEAVNTVAFSPDGHTLATASNDRSVKLWDTRSHDLIATLTGHTNMVEGVAFSPDGRTLATAGSDRTVRLWNIRSHHQLAVLRGHTDRVLRLAFSPDGRTLASADNGRTTRLWKVSSRTTVAVLAGRTGAVKTVAFSPDGRTMATAGTDHTVKLWDTGTHRLRATLTGHTQPVQQVAFAPDGHTLASTSTDGTVRLWRPSSSKRLATMHVEDPSYALAFSPDSRTLATTGKDSTIRLWSVRSTRAIATLAGQFGTVTSGVPFATRRAALTVDRDHLIARWSPTAGSVHPTPVEDRPSSPGAVTSSDGHVMVTAADDGTVRVRNLVTGRSAATLTDAPGSVSRLAISADGRTVAAGGEGGTIRVWDVGTRRTKKVLRGPRAVNGLAIDPRGRSVAATASDGSSRLWHLRPGGPARPLVGPREAAGAVAFSPDGRTLAVGTTDNNSMRLWDVATHRTRATLTGHTGSILGASFSPDGSTLATTSMDRSIRLWNPETARLRATLTGPTALLSTASFSPDGRALATFGSPDTPRVWSTDADDVAARVCRLSGDHHWAQLLPDQPVSEVC